MKFTSKKYLSVLAGVLFLLTFLMTGCAKDEAIAPLSEDETFKAMQIYDGHQGDNNRANEDVLDDGITDDEDDEDDNDRSAKR